MLGIQFFHSLVLAKGIMEAFCTVVEVQIPMFNDWKVINFSPSRSVKSIYKLFRVFETIYFFPQGPVHFFTDRNVIQGHTYEWCDRL
jgi:hypothetical protein